MQDATRLLDARAGDPGVAPAEARLVVWKDPFSRRRFAAVPVPLARRLHALAAAGDPTVREQLLALVNLSARRHGLAKARRHAARSLPRLDPYRAHRLLTRDVADAVHGMGCSVDDVALASGLPEDEVWLLAQRHRPQP